MTESVQPALTPEEWADLEFGDKEGDAWIHEDVEQLKSGIFPFTTKRRSTVGEIIASRAIVRAIDAHTLIDSTEQGHRRRAYLAARIIYAFTGVTVLTADYPGGTYRSPPWEYVRDILAATWWKLTHRFT